MTLAPALPTGEVVSERLLGVNLEMVESVGAFLVSNRLRNGKFCGPADPQTGIAPEWKPFGNNMGGMHARLIEGMALSGVHSQLLHNYSQPYGAGLVQTGVPIRKGERLELRLWAKVRHRPVRLQVALRALASRNEEGYANAEVLLDTAYWSEYRVSLTVTADDPAAVLFLLLPETGVVIFDQVALVPEGATGVEEAALGAIEALAPSLIRFPGGCISTNYRWKEGVGPRHLRPMLPDPVFKGRAEYEFGTDEYLELCQRLAIPPHLTLCIGSATLEEACEWAAYVVAFYRERGEEPPAAYLQIGNEQYGSWETSHMNAAMYLEVLRRLVPKLREIYPSARVIALAEPFCGGVAGEEATALRPLLLAEGQGLFDLLTINRYKGQWFDDPAQQLANARESVGKILADLEQLRDDCLAAGWEPRLALTEWNYWLHASHWDGKGFYEPDDAFHAIFFVGVIHGLARLGAAMELATYYHLANFMGLLSGRAGEVRRSAVGDLFALYREALPGERLEVASPHPSLDLLAVEAAGGRRYLFLVHGHEGEGVRLSLDSAWGEVVEIRAFVAPAGAVPMRPVMLEPVGGVVTLSPLSVTRLSLL